MRKFLNSVNTLVIASTFVAAYVQFDLLAVVGCVLLFAVNLSHKCISSYYLLLIFNLHFTLRYFEIRALGFPYLFKVSDAGLLGYYFFLACLMYVGIAVSVNVTSRHGTYESIQFNQGVGKVGAASMLMFSFAALTGQYKIGRAIGNGVIRVIVRISLFFQYWMPALFFLRKWVLIAVVYVVAMLVFGSKAFIYEIVLLTIMYGVISDAKLKYGYLLLVVVGGVASLLLFNVILAYRVSGAFNLNLFEGAKSSHLVNSGTVTYLISHIATRWGGLDTLIAYGESSFRYSIVNLYYEVISAINNFLPGVKIPLPYHYLTSEFMTAYLFRGYNFYNVLAGQLAHTDSMFGLSRFIAVANGLGILMYFTCLMFPFVFKFRDYFVDKLVRILFFTSVIDGGSYAETLRLVFALSISFVLLRLGGVRKVLRHSPDLHRRDA